MNANWHRYIAIVGGLLAIGWLAMGAVPVASDDFYGVDEDMILTIAAPGVLENDTDVDADPLTAILISSTSYGVLSLNSDGSFTYEPNPDFNGIDTFTYVASDGTGASNQVTVAITVHSVNDTPVGVDKFVSTQPTTAVSFTLEASDPDIDPLFPERHPLTFTIISGPSHGTISGDLSLVTYGFPDVASVSLVYTPDAGYVGMDSITFSVTDPFGVMSIAVIYIEVRERGVLSSLTGRWNTSIALEGEPFSVRAVRSKLTAFYEVGPVNIRTDAAFRNHSFSSFRLRTDFPFGDAIAIRSTLCFDPTVPAFRRWRTVTRFLFFDLDFVNTIHVPQDMSDLYTRFAIRGRMGGLSFASTTKLTGPALAFDEGQLLFRWRWPRCDLPLSARFDIDYEGFDRFLFTAWGIPVFRLDPFFGIYLHLATTLTPTRKTLSPTLTCTTMLFDCLQILSEVVVSDGTTIEGILFYGTRLRVSLVGGIELRMNTSFVAEKNASVTGHSRYFSAWTLFGPIMACPGGGRWQIEAYFKYASSQLFNWGTTSFKAKVPLTDQVRLSTRFEFCADDPTWEWDFGFNVMW